MRVMCIWIRHIDRRGRYRVLPINPVADDAPKQCGLRHVSVQGSPHCRCASNHVLRAQRDAIRHVVGGSRFALHRALRMGSDQLVARVQIIRRRPTTSTKLVQSEPYKQKSG